MRILVLSDSHRNLYAVKSVLNRHGDIKEIFFLGDNTDDIDSIKDAFPDRVFNIVSGNCDGGSLYKSSDVKTLLNTRIFFCHGHRQNVKYTLETLKNTARTNNCTLALFGHTHKSMCAYDDGLYILNPGSCSSSREGPNSYAIVDITEKGIIPSIMKV
ncbi:MAG: YfcE family phosphodiesterase [Acutalibacteraceae bacterium]|nr:YfcE family phosphodiesterase [Acutalibacteraceae bacterium]